MLYRDKSLYVWDISNINMIGKHRSYLFHSACVCAIEVGNYSKTPHLRRTRYWGWGHGMGGAVLGFCVCAIEVGNYSEPNTVHLEHGIEELRGPFFTPYL